MCACVCVCVCVSFVSLADPFLRFAFQGHAVYSMTSRIWEMEAKQKKTAVSVLRAKASPRAGKSVKAAGTHVPTDECAGDQMTCTKSICVSSVIICIDGRIGGRGSA
jgi:hypothetical protein